jgi:hypothetical protein
METCRGCGSYELLRMITSGRAYGYSGDIPCCRCIRFGRSDEYSPVVDVDKYKEVTDGISKS